MAWPRLLLDMFQTVYVTTSTQDYRKHAAKSYILFVLCVLIMYINRLVQVAALGACMGSSWPNLHVVSKDTDRLGLSVKQIQSTLAITYLAISDPLLYRTGQRLQDFTPANYPLLYRTAIQYRTRQGVKVFISLFPYISPLL